MQRNELLNLLKFVLITIVCFHHTGWWGDNMHHGYIAVEFFFIVSGYFLYQTFIIKKKSLKKYFYSRLYRLYPTYFTILLIYLFFSIIFPQFYGDYSLVDWVISAISDIFLLQSVGLDIPNVTRLRFNPPDWYVSAFFWSSILLYGILKFKNLCIKCLMAIVICIYSLYFIFRVGGLNELWGYYYILYMPLWRALAGMSVGVLLGMILQKEYIRNYLIKNIRSFNICAIMSMVMIVYGIITSNDFDAVCCLCFICIVSNALIPQGLGCYIDNIKCLKRLPDISFEILLLHKITIPISVKIMTKLGVLDIVFVKYIGYICFTICVAYLFNQKIAPILFKKFIKYR